MADIKVLLIENEPNDSALIMKLFQETTNPHFQVSHVQDLNTALNSLSCEKFDIILLNLALPDSGGVYTLTKTHKQSPTIPIVIINGSDDEMMMVKCMEEGAQDYIIKSQLGTRGLGRVISCSIARMNRALKLEQDKKVASLAEMAQEIEGSLTNPITDIREKMGELKDIVLAPELDKEVAITLLGETEEIAKDFTTVLGELRSFVKEVPQEVLNQSAEHKRKCNFLVVDDEPEIVELIVSRLRKLGFENIDSASNGQDAYNMCVARINKAPLYDAIISDWKMPKLTGIEFLEKIRKNDILKNTFFLMVSAIDEIASVKDAIGMRVTQYIIKPFRVQEFDRKIGYMARRLRS